MYPAATWREGKHDRVEMQTETTQSNTQLLEPMPQGDANDPAAKRLARLTPPPKDYTLSVLIPVYNERETLTELLHRVRDVEIKKEIIMVDDGSNRRYSRRAA